MPLLLIVLFISLAFAQIQGETPALSTQHQLVAMPTYTYTRVPGTLGLEAEEETWTPDKWKNRQIFGRFVPIMDWEIATPSLWFYTGNELGDQLWQELSSADRQPNSTPMLYGGFTTPPFGGFYGVAKFSQIDHFSESTMNVRKKRIDNSQKFSWFGENLPAYSGVFGGLGYKNANILAGSEYVWAFDEKDSAWVPIRISPRIEGNLDFNFMEKKVELHAATEKFQIQDSAAQTRNNFGLRLSGENTGGGLYVSRAEDKEYITMWVDFNHSFFKYFTNKGFIGFYDSLLIADSLEYKVDISKNTDLIIGTLFRTNGIKVYGETSYNFIHLFMKTRAYKNYAPNFQSTGIDSEVAYRSRITEAGAAYSKEFFDDYSENSAKLFLKYRFLQNLIFAHEWIYRTDTWFWNAQIEQKIPKLNASLYAVWLNALSNNAKDFDFGGVNRARFYCGANLSF
ncbi:MAG: hypothetical protein FWC26_08660 [Fibromonadales bacterium]|nr:hypothetical protein [Fibromonadales bacterium]